LGDRKFTHNKPQGIKMNINKMSEGYVDALLGKAKVDGGILFHQNLDISKFDGKLDSLKYIDEVLDIIHEAGMADEEILNSQNGQNFLYALAFYVGYVVGNENGEKVNWITNDEFLKINPDTAKIIGNGFETSIIYNTSKTTQFPLTSIVVRLFEGPDEKSVWYSASGAIIPKDDQKKSKWKLW